VITQSARAQRLAASPLTLAWRRHRLLALLLLPVLFSFAWKGYILALELANSLQFYNLARPWVSGFAGLANYQRMLGDELFWLSLQNTVVWTVGCVIPQLLLGMALALLLNQEMAFRGIYRAFALSPWAVSGAVGALMWSWMFNGPFGLFNDIFNQFGLLIGRPAWLASPDTAMMAVIVANVWRGIPFFAVTILAGLQAIPEELHEAAEIDGAGDLQRFWHITLPLLKGVITVTVLLRTVWTVSWVETILVMTGGGPANATMTLPLYVFNQFFRFSDVGYASAMAVVLFALLALFAVVYLRLLRLDELQAR
jgi:multiple sugar transport system permease protein